MFMFMEKNIIFVENCNLRSIKNILNNWRWFYSELALNLIEFKCWNIVDDKLILAANEKLTNELFVYLVNYIKYSEGKESKIEVKGYTIAEDENVFPNEFLNKEVLIYLPKENKEFDNVYAISEDNITYKIDLLGNKIKEETLISFSKLQFNFSRLGSPNIIKLNKNFQQAKKEKEIEEIPYEEIKKRFQIRIIIALIAFISGFGINLINLAWFNTFYTLFVSSIFCCFFTDYRMLRYKDLYLCSLIISILIFLTYFILGNTSTIFTFSQDKFAFSIMPLLFLLIQKPSRKLFIFKLKREPVVERGFSFDTIYSSLLIMTTFIFSVLIFEFVF